jgi:hypothetical protein
VALPRQLGKQARSIVVGGLVDRLRRGQTRYDPGPEDMAEWFRQRLRIRDKSANTVPFDPNPVQLRMEQAKDEARAAGRPPHFLVLKARRFGVTTFEQGRNYRAIARTPNTDVVTLAHTGDATLKIFRIAKMMAQNDPHFAQLRTEVQARSIHVGATNSTFTVGTAGGASFGRGDTLQRVHGSEVSRWCRGPKQFEEQEEIISGLTEAASHGEVVFESTAYGVEWFCQTYRDAKKYLNDWTPLFFPWWCDPTYRDALTDDEAGDLQANMAEEEKALMAMQGLDLNQIAWRRRTKRRLQRLFPQEYPEDDETCFLQSGVCYFDRDVIMSLLEVVPEPVKKAVPGGYIVKRRPAVPGRKYVAGVDTSEGLPGCDPNGIGILDKETGEQVAWAHGLFKIRELAELSVNLCREYNDAFLGVERNNHGHAVLEKVKDLGYGAPHRCYHFSKGRPGWDTSGETRPIMIEDLSTAIVDGSLKVHDKDFLGECLSFNLQEGGKFEADSGTHDDTVMKWAVAWQMRKVKPVTAGIAVLGKAKPTEEEKLEEARRKQNDYSDGVDQ